MTDERHRVAAGAPWTDAAQVGRGPHAWTSCAGEKVWLWGWTHYERPRGTRICTHLGNLTESCISDVFWGVLWGSLGEGNGSPLRYWCLENPVDGGAWWAAVHRIAQSRRQLKQLSMHACIGEGNGSPLPYSCLENPRDWGAWWAAVYGVAQSRILLTWPSSSSSLGSLSWHGSCWCWRSLCCLEGRKVWGVGLWSVHRGGSLPSAGRGDCSG